MCSRCAAVSDKQASLFIQKLSFSSIRPGAGCCRAGRGSRDLLRRTWWGCWDTEIQKAIRTHCKNAKKLPRQNAGSGSKSENHSRTCRLPPHHAVQVASGGRFPELGNHGHPLIHPQAGCLRHREPHKTRRDPGSQTGSGMVQAV